MLKGDIGKFLKAPNDHVEMKVIFSRYVGENLLQSVEAISGWHLVCYDNVNRKYGKYELTIQKGGKNGVSFDFKGKKFDEETVIKVLVENGHLKDAKEFNNLPFYLAKWEQERIFILPNGSK